MHITIIGAGLAGLNAALILEEKGHDITLIERKSDVGGRVWTEHIDGFTLDKGFQVLLTSYPEFKKLGIRNELGLKYFDSGALCYYNENWVPIYNPLQQLFKFCQSIKTLPKLFLSDFLKLGIGQFKKCTHFSTLQYLASLNISSELLNAFIRPFFTGVFLENQLITNASLFQKYLQGFALGKASLPKRGMQMLPQLMFHRLKNTKAFFNSSVVEISSKGPRLGCGKVIDCDRVIVATDEPALQALFPGFKARQSHPVTTLYFETPKSECINHKLIYLNSKSFLANLCILSQIQPSYAPSHCDLLQVSLLSDAYSDRAIAQEASRWIGLKAEQLKLIQRITVMHALPRQVAPYQHNIDKKNVILAGEINGAASIDGALRSARDAASKIIE